MKIVLLNKICDNKKVEQARHIDRLKKDSVKLYDGWIIYYKPEVGDKVRITNLSKSLFQSEDEKKTKEAYIGKIGEITYVGSQYMINDVAYVRFDNGIELKFKTYEFEPLEKQPAMKDSKIVKDVKPRKGESKEDFISRFMKETVEEYPDEKQRAAIAYSYWDRSKKIKDSNFASPEDDDMHVFRRGWEFIYYPNRPSRRFWLYRPNGLGGQIYYYGKGLLREKSLGWEGNGNIPDDVFDMVLRYCSKVEDYQKENHIRDSAIKDKPVGEEPKVENRKIISWKNSITPEVLKQEFARFLQTKDESDKEYLKQKLIKYIDDIKSDYKYDLKFVGKNYSKEDLDTHYKKYENIINKIDAKLDIKLNFKL